MTPGRAAWASMLAGLLLACGGGRTPPAEAGADSTAEAARFPAMPDSLALRGPDGVEVWFTGARTATDSAGQGCIERGLTIVRGESRMLVPLLMTGAVPTLVNDSTIRARIWLDCRPGNTYEVNLRTAIPTRTR
ncbi:MAG TPA: hypothetical protein VFV65_02640 [Gemmatimonadales bacterium]|nr:hypothetical protein [Gemmatimonadales bacterium]